MIQNYTSKETIRSKPSVGTVLNQEPNVPLNLCTHSASMHHFKGKSDLKRVSKRDDMQFF